MREFINQEKNKNYERFHRNNGIRGNCGCRRKRSKHRQADRVNWVWCRSTDEIFKDLEEQESHGSRYTGHCKDPIQSEIAPIIFLHILWPDN
jgi:hypothetical protein